MKTDYLKNISSLETFFIHEYYEDRRIFEIDKKDKRYTTIRCILLSPLVGYLYNSMTGHFILESLFAPIILYCAIESYFFKHRSDSRYQESIKRLNKCESSFSNNFSIPKVIPQEFFNHTTIIDNLDLGQWSKYNLSNTAVLFPISTSLSILNYLLTLKIVTIKSVFIVERNVDSRYLVVDEYTSNISEYYEFSIDEYIDTCEGTIIKCLEKIKNLHTNPESDYFIYFRFIDFENNC